jgi:hypothetical protein
MPDMAKVQALLQDRKSPKSKGRASAPLPIVMDADLAVDLAQARQELANAEYAITEWAKKVTEGDHRQGGKPKPPADMNKRVAAAQERVDELKAEADEVTVLVVFVAMPADQQDELEKLHPPREGNKADEEQGINLDTFPRARMRECAAKVVDFDDNVLPLDPIEIVDGMSTGERGLAIQVVNGISSQVASVPFFDASSQSRQRSGGKPRRP